MSTAKLTGSSQLLQPRELELNETGRLASAAR
jgi:hypothetical protein